MQTIPLSGCWLRPAGPPSRATTTKGNSCGHARSWGLEVTSHALQAPKEAEPGTLERLPSKAAFGHRMLCPQNLNLATTSSRNKHQMPQPLQSFTSNTLSNLTLAKRLGLRPKTVKS